MNTQDRSGKYLNRQLKTIVGRLVALDAMLHTHLCECALHLKNHGDVIYIERTLNGLPQSARTATIKLWFGKFIPDIVAKTDKETKLLTLSMKKGWSADKIDIEAMEAKPYWTLAPEKTPGEVSLESIVGIIKGFYKKIDKSVAEGTFKGDAALTKAALAPVISLAERRAQMVAAGKLSDRLENARETEQVQIVSRGNDASAPAEVQSVAAAA